VVAATVENFLRKQRAGAGVLMEHMRGNRAWNNPLFLEKMTSYFHLEQYGSALRPDVWCPSSLPSDDAWPALQQQLAARKRPRGGEVKFAGAGVQQQAAAAAMQQHQQHQQQHQGLPPLSAAAVAAAAAAGSAAASLAHHPGMAAKAPTKLVTIDPRAAIAQAQALAASLAAAGAAAAAAGGGAAPPPKKSKWDK
jgi:hypothetical protein